MGGMESRRNGADPQQRTGMWATDGADQAARGSGENGAETSITATETGDREE
jgi:hypothetical protein